MLISSRQIMRAAIVPAALLAASTVPTEIAAQTPRTERAITAFPGTALSVRIGGPRSVLGVTLAQSPGPRDTLGILISGVSPDSPADRAGLQEGNRIASINGVNLRVSAADAGDREIAAVMNRRLQRVLDTTEVGGEVELGVYAEGELRTVRLQTEERQAATSIFGAGLEAVRANPDRPSIGASLGGQASPRDTLGLFVFAVAEDGPLAVAGIHEGARIAAVNGVNLRVSAADLGDPEIAAINMRRLTRELEKLSPGDRAELRVWVNGQFRDVTVTVARQSELQRPGTRIYFGPGTPGTSGTISIPGDRIIRSLLRTPPD
jgi:predicted metalloprotease with PDZ domain